MSNIKRSSSNTAEIPVIQNSQTFSSIEKSQKNNVSYKQMLQQFVAGGGAGKEVFLSDDLHSMLLALVVELPVAYMLAV